MLSRVSSLDSPKPFGDVGRIVRETRALIGWSQRELAVRAGTSQATIWRLETGRSTVADVGLIGRILTTLGIRWTTEVEANHLEDRRRQRDPVHARLAGHVARRLDRAGWATALEVPIGHPVPRGWIDLLAYRERDAALLITEVKGDLPDIGGLQRQLARYVRAAPTVARGLAWPYERTAVLLVGLDTWAVHDRVTDNREALSRTMPGSPVTFQQWLDNGGSVPRPTLALVDPMSRRRRWLRRTPLSGRRSAASFRDYADAARRLGAGGSLSLRPAAPPRHRPARAPPPRYRPRAAQPAAWRG